MAIKKPSTLPTGKTKKTILAKSSNTPSAKSAAGIKTKNILPTGKPTRPKN